MSLTPVCAERRESYKELSLSLYLLSTMTLAPASSSDLAGPVVRTSGVTNCDKKGSLDMDDEPTTSLPPSKAQTTAPPDLVVPSADLSRQCASLRARGGRCTSFAALGTTNCRAHSTDPAVIEASRKSSRRGGLQRVRQSVEAKLAAMGAGLPAKVGPELRRTSGPPMASASTSSSPSRASSAPSLLLRAPTRSRSSRWWR